VHLMRGGRSIRAPSGISAAWTGPRRRWRRSRKATRTYPQKPLGGLGRHRSGRPGAGPDDSAAWGARPVRRTGPRVHRPAELHHQEGQQECKLGLPLPEHNVLRKRHGVWLQTSFQNTRVQPLPEEPTPNDAAHRNW